MDRPTEAQPTWAESGATVAPPSGKIDSGWSPGDAPPAQWLNFLYRRVRRWTRFVIARGDALVTAAGMDPTAEDSDDVANAVESRARTAVAWVALSRWSSTPTNVLPWQSIAYGGGWFAAVAPSENWGFSRDGVVWTEDAFGTSNRHDIIWDGTQFVAVGENAGASEAEIATTVEPGSGNYTTYQHQGGVVFEKVHYDPASGRYFIADDSNQIYSPPDPSTTPTLETSVPGVASVQSFASGVYSGQAVVMYVSNDTSGDFEAKYTVPGSGTWQDVAGFDDGGNWLGVAYSTKLDRWIVVGTGGALRVIEGDGSVQDIDTGISEGLDDVLFIDDEIALVIGGGATVLLVAPDLSLVDMSGDLQVHGVSGSNLFAAAWSGRRAAVLAPDGVDSEVTYSLSR